jgi:acyl-CoA reductase-like NAD-dependent aldehyde dehydrogenase
MVGPHAPCAMFSRTFCGFSRFAASETLNYSYTGFVMLSREPTSWATLSLDTRIAWLTRFRRLVAASEPQLCELMREEVRKPRDQGLLTDIAPLLAACKWLEDAAPRLLRDREVPGKPWWMTGVRVHERRLPLGRVGIIATWNYPVQLLGIQMIQALVAGNTVVVKPSERCPKTQTRLLELAIEAGLPAGALSWVGHGREAGVNMLNTQAFDHVVFTGSTEVGQRIATTLAKTMTPATLELSGRDSAFVLEDANAKKAAHALWGALIMNSGQTCMGPRRVLVMEKVYEKFIKEIIKLASDAPTVDLIDENASQRCKELVSKALGRGARDAGLLTPTPPKLGSNVNGDEINRRFRVTALVDCDVTMDVVEGRHFGPLLAIVKCHNLEEALAIHHKCDQHLAVSIFTSNAQVAPALAARLNASNVIVNDCIVPTGHPAISIGGSGPSGMGVSRGEEGLMALTRPVYLSKSSFIAARMAKPMPGWQVQWVAKLMRWWYEAGKAERRDLGRVLPTGMSTLPEAQAPQAIPQGSLPLAEPGAPRPISQQQIGPTTGTTGRPSMGTGLGIAG